MASNADRISPSLRRNTEWHSVTFHGSPRSAEVCWSPEWSLRLDRLTTRSAALMSSEPALVPRQTNAVSDERAKGR